MRSQSSTDPEANKRRAFFGLEGKRGGLQQQDGRDVSGNATRFKLRTQAIVTDFRGPLILDVPIILQESGLPGFDRQDGKVGVLTPIAIGDHPPRADQRLTMGPRGRVRLGLFHSALRNCAGPIVMCSCSSGAHASNGLPAAGRKVERCAFDMVRKATEIRSLAE